MEGARFDELVTGLYRAATGAIGWPAALEPLRQVFGARAAVLHTVDFTHGPRLAALSCALEDEHMQLCELDYLRHWHGLDPRRKRLIALGPEAMGRWLHCTDAFDAGFAQRDRFYREFLPAYGLRYHAALTVPVAEGVATGFALELPPARGPLTADERHFAERIGHHVQDALRAHERVRRIAAQALSGHRLLAGFAHPMWLLSADRFIFHANPAAESEVVGEAIAALDGQRLVLRSAQADRRLTDRLSALVAAGHGARAVVDARLRPLHAPCLLHLQLLEPQQVLGAFGTQPLVLATLFDAARVAALDPRALGDLLGLTPTQSRVAALLAEGLTAAQIGARLGIALATVRTHLRAVLGRLGATRSVDAVRALREGYALWARTGA